MCGAIHHFSASELAVSIASPGFNDCDVAGPFHSWCDKTTNLFTLKNAKGSLPRRGGGSWLSKWWRSNWLLLEQIPLEDFLLQQFQLSTAQKTFHQFVERVEKKGFQCAISFQYPLKVTDNNNRRLATVRSSLLPEKMQIRGKPCSMKPDAWQRTLPQNKPGWARRSTCSCHSTWGCCS